jgi:hypothetical protein
MGPADDLRKHAEVGAMHAVKVSHTDYCGPKPGGNIFEFVKNLHLPSAFICVDQR